MDATDWSVVHWNKRFDRPDAEEWMSTETDKRLLKYEAEILGGKDKHKMYFPLCGYAIDMKWAYDKGYEVVGLDCVVPALRKFFSTHDIKYTEESCDAVKGTLLQSEDKRIRLYGCDVADFKGDLEKDVTAVWDSAAISALNKGLRQTYCDIIKTMMSPGARASFMLLDYDSSAYPGPPHCISMDDLQKLFGSGYQFKLLETADFMKEMCDMMDSVPEDASEGHHHDKETTTSEVKVTKEKSADELLDDQFMKLKEFWGSYVLVTKD